MNADVEKAVERIDHRVDYFRPIMETDWHTIRQALRDQDAELARQYECIRSHGIVTRRAEERAEKAEAMLRRVVAAHTGENVDGCDMRNADIDHITAHLGGEHE